MRQGRHALAVAGLALLVAGCQQMNHTGSGGALLGTGLGAATGAAIGGESGHAGGGALIGAATGALAGGLIGNAADARDERDAAVAHAQYAEARAQVVSQALTSGDVIAMAHQGVGDDVIINSIHTRGCRFDGAPESIIQLKQQGVSDRVLAAMQSTAAHGPPAPVATSPPPVVYGAPPPPPGPGGVVIVAPGYRRGPYWGPPAYGPYWGPRPYYRRYWW